MPPDVPSPAQPSPSATGTLAKTPLSHLLVYALDRQLSGTFEFTGPGVAATVVFSAGQPVKAQLDDPSLHLGRVLCDLGVLTDDQQAELGAELNGKALLADGWLTAEQLELGLRSQLVRHMRALARFPPDSQYRYFDAYDGLATADDDARVTIDPFPIVWASIRDTPPWEQVHAGLTRLGVAGLSLAEHAETARFAFDKAERTLVDLLRQRACRVDELLAAATLPPATTQLVLYCLLVTKQVVLAADPSSDEAPSSAPISAPPTSAPPSDSGQSGPRALARVQLAQRTVTRAPVVVEDASAARPGADEAQGSTAYVATQPRSLRKRSTMRVEAPSVPPSSESSPGAVSSQPPGGDVVDDVPSSPASTPPMRSDPQPYIPRLSALTPAQFAVQAPHAPTSERSPAAPPPSVPRPSAPPVSHRTSPPLPLASNPAPSVPPPSSSRSSLPPSSQRALDAGPPSVRSKPPISLRAEDLEAPPSSRSPGAASIRAMQMTADLVARKKEIQERAASLDREDYYSLLGVAPDTPSSEVQKAFFSMAKKWHPDRVPAVLVDVKDLCARVFARMSEAHQTLMDPSKRAKYDQSRGGRRGADGADGADDSPEAQAKVAAILEAATNFQKAEICFKRNDMKQAEELCMLALDADPRQADYIALLAWLQALKPQKQDAQSTQQIVVELSRAIQISQACERAFFYRALLLKRLGQEPQSMKDFKRALELNPRNLDAQREIRLFNMRGGAKGAPKDDGGGLFGKLFKK